MTAYTKSDVTHQHHIYHEFFSKTHTAKHMAQQSCSPAPIEEFLVLETLGPQQLQQIRKQFLRSTSHKCHSTIDKSCQYMSHATQEPWCAYHSNRNIVCSGQWCRARFSSYMDDEELTEMFAELNIQYTVPDVPLPSDEGTLSLGKGDEGPVRPRARLNPRRRRRSCITTDSGYCSTISTPEITLELVPEEVEEYSAVGTVAMDLSIELRTEARNPSGKLARAQPKLGTNTPGLLKDVPAAIPPSGSAQVNVQSQLASGASREIRTYSKVAAGVGAVSGRSSVDLMLIPYNTSTSLKQRFGFDPG